MSLRYCQRDEQKVHLLFELYERSLTGSVLASLGKVAGNHDALLVRAGKIG